ncbi:hypothetical protein CRX57_21100 [Pseudomonas putida]|uniref:Uncharacterized protein n=1 Tax=Pseudomonas putida TaxID=303 RepID=A0A2C5VV52_PSEPU|nr:hypothetical protein CRX57_21100 [Pseudomonas putida]
MRCVIQPMCWRTHHFREQARSHSLNGVAFRCGTIPATFSHTRIDHTHERPPHTQTCAQEA